MYGLEPGINWWVFFGVSFMVTTLGFIVLPLWNVWASRLGGQAKLQEANNEQKIQIATAQARLDAAEINKKAAIIEAEAVAQQIEKIGKNLKTHDLYLKWQWIKMMETRPDSSVIYVPTEANIPILEAGRTRSLNENETEDEAE